MENFLFGILIGLIGGTYLVVRIVNIKQEMQKTGKLKKPGFIEKLLFKELNQEHESRNGQAD